MHSRPEAKRLLPFLTAVVLLLSMLLSFAPPVVNAAATSSSAAGQTSSVVVEHYQIGHAPVFSTLSQGASTSSKKVTVLAKNQDGPQPMTVSGGYVYWYDDDSGQLNRVSESGGKVQTLATASTYESFGDGVAVEGNYVYWTHESPLVSFWLNRTDISTGKTTNLYSTSSVFGAPGPFAVSGSRVYFIVNSNIYKIDTNGSNLVELAFSPSPCAAEDTYSAGVVYWLDACTGQVGSIPASGGTAKLLSPALSDEGTSFIGVTQLDVVGSRLYWTFNGGTNSSVDTVSTSGKDFKMLYSTSGMGQLFGGLSYWNGDVIFANYYNYPSGAIYSVPHDGGKLRTVVDYPTVNLDVAGGTIYLVSPQESTVGRTKV